MSKIAKVLILLTLILFTTGIAQTAAKADETVKCSCVCGKEIKKADVKTFEYKGKVYNFCCDKCKDAFAKAPEKSLKTVYTCSICPDVKSDKPGKCPKCGKELEKKEMVVCACCQGKEGMAAGCKMKGCGMEADTVKCPVSGEAVKKTEAKVTTEYKGQTYYFCCEKCKEAFLKEPEKYLKEVYVCTMCKDVISDKPGKCPKCGMNLVAKMVQKNCCEEKTMKAGCAMMGAGKTCCTAKAKLTENKKETEKK